MNSYEIIIETTNPCGGKAHSQIEIVEAELENPMDYVNPDYDWITESVDQSGTVVIETTKAGYIKRYTFSKT